VRLSDDEVPRTTAERLLLEANFEMGAVIDAMVRVSEAIAPLNRPKRSTVWGNPSQI
jgi:hypothetical protein